MLKARFNCCKRFSEGQKEFDGSADHIAEFLDELGTYMKNKAIPDRILWEVQSWYVEHYWRMFEEHIRNVRTSYKDHSLFSEFEFMYHQMRKTSKRQNASVHERDVTELGLFADAELLKTQELLTFTTTEVNI